MCGTNAEQVHIPLSDMDLHSYMVDANDICSLMFHTELSVALRASGRAGLECTSTGSKTTLRYMPLTTTVAGSTKDKEELEIQRLLVFLMNSRRVRPIPSICRGNDVNNHYLDQAVQTAFPGLFQENNHRRDGRFWEAVDENRGAMADILFMALFNRVMGRVSALEGYREEIENDDDYSPSSKQGIPRRSQIERFLIFLQSRVGGTSVAPAMNQQHDKHVPAKLKDLSTFKSFIGYMAGDGLRDFEVQLLEMANVADASPTRDDVVALWSRTILRAYEGSESGDAALMKKINFLSHHSLADCEEFFHLPFGEVTEDSVHEGYGGQEGQMLCRPLSCQTTTMPKGKFMTKKEAYTELIGVLKTKSAAFLRSISIVKGDDGVLCWKKRGRPLCLTDFEHICCKIWINCRGSYASHTVSENPKPFNSYTWTPHAILPHSATP